MALHTTRWRPDTCACAIDYEWDDAVPADQRVHTQVAAVTCAEHAGMETTEFDVVLDENQRKNISLEETRLELGLPEGAEIPATWSYSGTGLDRVLNLAVDTTVPKRTNLRNTLDARFGAGKTRVLPPGQA